MDHQSLYLNPTAPGGASDEHEEEGGGDGGHEQGEGMEDVDLKKEGDGSGDQKAPAGEEEELLEEEHAPVDDSVPTEAPHEFVEI
jgi:hypothetical protein